MMDGLKDLTDKEREALRLLLAGHDAKSSASELDISVHTVNDRLRNARRKLGTSSSREAARILGEAEEASPQNDAHKEFGIGGESAATDNAGLNNPWHASVSRTAWLAGGMLIMSIAIAFAVIALLHGGNTPIAEPTAPAEISVAASAEDAASMQRAQAFLAEVDAGDWEGSWEAAGPFFQSQATRAQWAELVEPVRAPLGAMQSRSVTTVQRASNLPGGPEGEYEILQFNTRFAGRSSPAIETIVMMLGADGWEVTGYFIA